MENVFHSRIVQMDKLGMDLSVNLYSVLLSHLGMDLNVFAYHLMNVQLVLTTMVSRVL